MFIVGPTPDRDSALDADLILHEYTHGLVNRYNGKGSGILADGQPGALDEGWADFYALTLLADPMVDVPSANYPFGAYSSRAYAAGGPSIGDQNNYYGFRRYP